MAASSPVVFSGNFVTEDPAPATGSTQSASDLAEPQSVLLRAGEARGKKWEVKLPAPLPTWAAAVVNRLMHLFDLPENWDVHGADRLTPSAFSRVLVCLIEIGPEVAAPFVAPTAHGGIQLEWDTDAIWLEIEVPPLDREPIVVNVERKGRSVGWEGEVLHVRDLDKMLLHGIRSDLSNFA